MYTFIVILILVVCVLLALVVLVQNSKGGGLAANFSAPTQVMGVRQTADFLEKATWWLAVILVVLCLAATVSIPHRSNNNALNTEVTAGNADPVQAASPITTSVPTADQQ
ncbi:MAG: preprotein translocase subunit SecG [Bacteroidales bacterium]|nr:preprotein translocase subunit SecG [Bacteroidales bacterium]